MTRNMLRCNFLLAALIVSISAFGGSKGFTVVFLEIGGEGFYESRVNSAFGDEYPDTKAQQDCWNSRATGGGENFDKIFKKAVPEGLTINLAKAIWSGDHMAEKRAQQILAKAKTPRGQSFDGLYIVNARDKKISVMALGMRAPLGLKNPSQKITIPWKEDQPEQGAADFDLALCRVSRPLDYHFSP